MHAAERRDSPIQHLAIEDWHRGRSQLGFRFRIGDLRFSTTCWYQDVDLPALEAAYGEPFLRRVYAHIALFEANKLASLRPETFDPGPFRELVTPRLERLWRTIFRHVWGQWRYENDLPDYFGPRLAADPIDRPPAPVAVEPSDCETLACCGGGKDSLVALRQLEEAGIPYASYAYSHSVYGPSRRQHELIDGLLGHFAHRRRHRQWIYDDFLDSPVVELMPEAGVRTLTAAETPASVFAALPVMLAHGYRHLVVAHERSADFGNLVWTQTGEEINHQWGKSLEAERLLADYVRSELVANARYFSLLKPVYDPVIFSMLNRDLDALPRTHSCNVSKPWCKRCPKCAYVWLNYMAYLPAAAVHAVFGDNLFDLPENQLWFRQMLGLDEHTPFECIGQIDESRLAFELCRRKGLTGRAMETYTSEVRDFRPANCLDSLLQVDPSAHAMPDSIASLVLPRLEQAAAAARQETAGALGLDGHA